MEDRKLIAHGPSSLTVSLPSKWLKRQGLKKGDKVHLEEVEQGLMIKSLPSLTARSLASSLIGLSSQEIQTVLTQLYRRGYDELMLSYQTPGEYQAISSAIRNLAGLILMEHGKQTCLVKALPLQPEEKFSVLLRRVFLILLHELEDLELAVASPPSLASFLPRDADVNALINLGIRMVNKGYAKERVSELHLFYFLLLLEEMGDDIVRFAIEAQASRGHLQELRRAVQYSREMVQLLYGLYFTKDKTLQDVYRRYYVFYPSDRPTSPPEIYLFFQKVLTKAPEVFYLRGIVEKVVAVAELLSVPERI